MGARTCESDLRWRPRRCATPLREDASVRARRDRPYDLLVLGGGTAGLVSAQIAASLGARVALVERDRTGGDCLWTGCVPSKSLLAAAHLAHAMRRAGDVGLAAVQPEVDFGAVMAHVHGAIATIEPHDSPERLRSLGVEVVQADASFTAPRVVAAGGRRLRARAVIVATGARPVLPPVPGLADAGALTSDTVWNLRELPSRLVVLGGGPIGCELAQAFARLGAAVTLVEQAGRLLDADEPEAAALVAASLRADGVDVRLGTRAVGVEAGELMVAQDAAQQRIAFDAIIAATGRRPRTDDLGAAVAGIALDERGAVTVDERLRTSAPHVYAAGDVTAQLPFTHVAAHHARVATINALLGTRRRVDTTIPWVTFTDPEVARVGLSAAQARERWGGRAVIQRIDYSEVDRAVAEGRPAGFALLVGDNRARLVGATVAATAGGEAIAELTARIAHGDKIDAVSTAVHAYPTFAEGPARAADEVLRRRYGAPPYRALSRAALALGRLVPRAR